MVVSLSNDPCDPHLPVFTALLHHLRGGLCEQQNMADVADRKLLPRLGCEDVWGYSDRPGEAPVARN